MFGKPGQRAIISVPIHGNRQLGPGLQNHLMKQAGLREEDFA
ncbi:MAG: type II toxin-antitoxin system HicA family toxin [Acidobacteria bacterium]|nr:type II toxin-antitoxin system HicA family toxin [Acidobacteriota bacterium]